MAVSAGSNPADSTEAYDTSNAPVAQRQRQPAQTRRRVGSTPTWGIEETDESERHHERHGHEFIFIIRPVRLE